MQCYSEIMILSKVPLFAWFILKIIQAPHKVKPVLTNPSMNKTKVKSNYRTHQIQKLSVELKPGLGDLQSGDALQYLLTDRL